jgi:hypothetical protein
MKDFGDMSAFFFDFASRLLDGGLCVRHLGFRALHILARSCLEFEKPLRPSRRRFEYASAARARSSSVDAC